MLDSLLSFFGLIFQFAGRMTNSLTGINDCFLIRFLTMNHNGVNNCSRIRPCKHETDFFYVTVKNIPTTLLAMVDASVGGKTGINFNGLKNEVGVFNDSKYVLLNTAFLDTLDYDNQCSGFGEMLKHALISDRRTWHDLLAFDLQKPDLPLLQKLVAQSVKVKERIVEQDPYEKNIRKALNLGHTVGHAFESWALKKGHPVLHGYAVAYGLVCELYLSVVKTGLPTEVLREAVNYVKAFYSHLSYTCDDYEAFFELMKHDKKNTADGGINFTLLDSIGGIKINQTASKEEIFEALDFYREN